MHQHSIPIRQRLREILGQALISAVIVVLALIPLWVYLGARAFLQPEGFWQNLILAGIGLYLLGTLQVLLIVIALMLLCAIWSDLYNLPPNTPRSPRG